MCTKVGMLIMIPCFCFATESDSLYQVSNGHFIFPMCIMRDISLMMSFVQHTIGLGLATWLLTAWSIKCLFLNYHSHKLNKHTPEIHGLLYSVHTWWPDYRECDILQSPPHWDRNRGVQSQLFNQFHRYLGSVIWVLLVACCWHFRWLLNQWPIFYYLRLPLS